MGKGGRTVWIQASYNPVFDEEGRVTKVIKIATDQSARMAAVGRLGAGLTRLAGNDLTQAIADPLPGTMEALREDYNKAVLQLAQTVGSIKSSSDVVQTSSVLIARSIDQLSAREASNRRPASNRPPPRSTRSRRPVRRQRKAPTPRARLQRAQGWMQRRPAWSCRRRLLR